MNVVDFNISLEKSPIGPKFYGVPYTIPEHKVMRSESSKQFAYCAMYGRSESTRVKCGETSCNITLFSVSSGAIEYNCFSNSYSNNQIIWATHANYFQIKAKTNKRCNDL